MKAIRYGFGFLLFSYLISFLMCFSFAQNNPHLSTGGIENFDLSGLYSSTRPTQPQASNNSSVVSKFHFRSQPYTEEIDKRTFTSRTFKGNEGEVLIQYSSQKLHFLDRKKKLQPIYAGLSPSPEGWSAPSQEFPTYLYKDGSVALSTGEEQRPSGKISFNRNCRINGAEINLSDLTVGEDGMFIHNAMAGVDKRIVFAENRIKTDYIINHPVPFNGNELIFSEEVGLPEGFYCKEEKSSMSKAAPFSPSSSYIVFSPKGKEVARFRAPVFFDAKNNFSTGTCHLMRENGKMILKIIVPGSWLNDPARAFPVTIDPLVTGPVSNYPSIFLNSCEYPNFEIDSMLVTIPGGITITGFFVEDSYYADVLVGALMSNGYMMLSTSCGAFSGTCDSVQSGTCYWTPGSDFKNQLACCFTPSCNSQSFYLTHGFSRTPAIYGTGCNQYSIYYTPNGLWPFSAYIEGRTVEISPAPPWSIFPTTVCADSCTIYLKATARYGVPPYTMTHPWSADTVQFGNAYTGCNSTGTDTIALKIPGCPVLCDTVPSMSVPPPLIIDACGDTITGLLPKIIALNPVPSPTASPVTICSGTQVYIPVSSCIGGSTITWSGSNGSAGSGDIFDNPNIAGPDTIDYSISNTAGSCTGQTINVSAVVFPKYAIPATADICAGNSLFLQGANQTQPGTYYDTLTTGNGCDSIIITTLTVTGISSASTADICEGENIFLQGAYQSFPGTYYDTLSTPGGCDSVVATNLTVFSLPVISTSSDVTIHAGDSAQLQASGGVSYLWSSGDTTANISVSPSESTTYSVAGTDSNNCTSSALVTVTVENTYNISVSNIFTPNGDNENDFIFVHGNGIKELKFAIFDRLGEKVFETNDKSVGWNGTYKNKPLNSAVFAYFLVATFEDGTEYKEKGNITLLR